ncbi:hypothetical protein GLOIN_2v1738467 [Rhizophagus irregularis DAOM 181602=DAOM 197198]|nr:hypothetical protein GLOIN_2v1738467 [Rhizophagus irregularis DAOM 181602=DAOM 197198]
MSFTIWIKYNNEQAVSVEFQTGTIDKLQPWVRPKLCKYCQGTHSSFYHWVNHCLGNLQSFEASGLERISDNDEITKDVDWSQIEDKAVEDETLLAVKNFLNKMFKLTVEIFPHRIMYKNQESIMEWDGILTCDNKVFLLETKHKMTAKHIENLINRLSEFQNKLLITDSLEFKKLLGNIMLELLASYTKDELKHVKKKRKADEAFDYEYEYVYGIVTTALKAFSDRITAKSEIDLPRQENARLVAKNYEIVKLRQIIEEDVRVEELEHKNTELEARLAILEQSSLVVGEQPQNDKETIVEVLPEVTVSNIDLSNTVIDQRNNVDTKTSGEMEMDAFLVESSNEALDVRRLYTGIVTIKHMRIENVIIARIKRLLDESSVRTYKESQRQTRHGRNIPNYCESEESEYEPKRIRRESNTNYSQITESQQSATLYLTPPMTEVVESSSSNSNLENLDGSKITICP